MCKVPCAVLCVILFTPHIIVKNFGKQISRKFRGDGFYEETLYSNTDYSTVDPAISETGANRLSTAHLTPEIDCGANHQLTAAGNAYDEEPEYSYTHTRFSFQSGEKGEQKPSTDDGAKSKVPTVVPVKVEGGERSEVEVGVNIAYKKTTTAPVSIKTTQEGEEGSDKQEHSLAADTSPKSRMPSVSVSQLKKDLESTMQSASGSGKAKESPKHDTTIVDTALLVDTKSDPQLSMAVSQLKKELELERGSGAVGVAREKKPAAVKSRVTAMTLGFEALKTSTETGPKKET